jgi:hypothetical protein
MSDALEPRTPDAAMHPRSLDQPQRIDLASALGVGLEEATGFDGPITITVCNDLATRCAYWAYIASQGAPGRNIQEAHPRAAILLAMHGDTPVGAAALIPDSPLGLPMPDGFTPTITRLRKDGKLIAVLDPLLISPDLEPRQAGLVLRGMLRLALLYARRVDGLSDLLLRCEARYARFFAQVLLFTVESELPPIGGAPAQILLRLDLDLCPGEYMRLYGDTTWSPYTMYTKASPRVAPLLHWLRCRRTPPTCTDLLHGWILSASDDAGPDPEQFAALCRFYPALAQHPGLPRHRPPSAHRAGTGPIPRIRTPLPWPDADD